MKYFVFLLIPLASPIQILAMQRCQTEEVKTKRIGIAPISMNAGYPQIISVRSGVYLDFADSVCDRFALNLFLEPGVTAAKGIFALSVEGYWVGIYAGIGYLHNYVSLSTNIRRQYLGGELGLRMFHLNLNAGVYLSKPLVTDSADVIINLQIGYTWLSSLGLK